MLDLVLAHNLRISPTLTNRIYILSARAAIAQGKYDLARDRLKEAGEGLEMDIWRGHVAFYQGEHQNAIETFEGLLETIIRKLYLLSLARSADRSMPRRCSRRCPGFDPTPLSAGRSLCPLGNARVATESKIVLPQNPGPHTRYKS